MQTRHDFSFMMMLCAVVLLAVAIPSAAQQETILHTFTSSEFGSGPYAPANAVVFDAEGNLYGTTPAGGPPQTENGGAAYELSPQADGSWVLSVLYFFNGGRDGEYPYSNLIFDSAGNLYGANSGGGADYRGVVFQLVPQAEGRWKENTLMTFMGQAAGTLSGLIFDKDGNLYGTNYGDGPYECGEVFELSPTPGGVWTQQVVHSFTGVPNGCGPGGNLVLDAAGNFYGITYRGGEASDGGTVYELLPKANGDWGEKILYSFDGDSASDDLPFGGPVLDNSGNLYGTARGKENGRDQGSGTVYKLSPSADGAWTQTILHQFNDDGVDGFTPLAGVVLDPAGNLYGTTSEGGAFGGGTVFVLSPGPDGSYGEAILHSFGSPSDGRNPQYGNLIFDSAGNLYGTTQSGGPAAGGSGTVFKITP
jgi:uncharacterized repeat protein (TIGR03803 family)